MKELLWRRLREKSTWAGIAIVAVTFGVPAQYAETISQALYAVVGAVAIFVPEKAE